MRRQHIAAAVLLALVLLVTLASRPAFGGGPENTYFGAVNDQDVRALVNGYMPQMINGTLLVPHLLLVDGDIGAQTQWSASQQYLTLSCGGKSVTFEFGSGKAFDLSSGETYSTKMTRTPGVGADYYYLELDFLCEFFGWSYTIQKSEWGNLVRIKTGAALIYSNDSLYLTLNIERMQRYYNAANQTPPPSEIPPVPSTSNPKPTPTPLPTQTPAPTPPPAGALSVYITFDGSPGEVARDILDALETHSVRAAFFLTEDGLRNADPALLRRLAATQVIGLCGDAADLEDPAMWLSQAERMNSALDATAFARTRLTRWPALYALTGRNTHSRTQPVRDALADGGFRLWDWTLDATGQPRLDAAGLADWIIKSLPPADEGPAVLRLSMDERAAGALPRLLNALDAPERYFLREVSLTDRPINRYGDIR